jgi:hypothetical protein
MQFLKSRIFLSNRHLPGKGYGGRSMIGMSVEEAHEYCAGPPTLRWRRASRLDEDKTSLCPLWLSGERFVLSCLRPVLDFRNVISYNLACLEYPSEKNLSAGVVKLVDARDSKSREPQAHVGSIPTSGTI